MCPRASYPTGPPDDPGQLDDLFGALSHADRRRMLDLLTSHPGLTVGALASHFPISRVAVIKHLARLERADLVIGERVGRERRLYFNPMPMRMVYDRWTDQYTRFFGERPADIRARVEAASGGKEKRHA
ncbi:MAG: metalloregulator ArsR/SmtB family transcription factor [Planctomycetota bacterium]